VMACEELTVLADRGYYIGDEVLACEGSGVLPYVPKTQTSGNTSRGLFTGQDFVYDAEHDRYTCPAGQHLTKGKVRSDRRDTIDHYRNLTACPSCALKPRCTPDKHKRVKRWEHEDVLDRMQERLERMPEAMLIRRQTVEHPFGTIKAWMGSTHFLDEDPGEGQNRDEPARAGLQSEADDQHPGCQAAAEGSGSLNPPADRCRPGLHTQTAAIARRLESRFHTASVRTRLLAWMNKGPLTAKLRTFGYQCKLTRYSRGLRESCLLLPVVLPGREIADRSRTQYSDKNPCRLRVCGGERAGTRTQDPLIKSQMLYRLSYALPEVSRR
jgi:hypothetical protein